MPPFPKEALAGAYKCIVEVGGVRKGENVLILNETGSRVEERAVEMLTAVAELEGATVQVMWTPQLVQSWWEDVPRIVVAAFEAADVVIHNHYTIGRPHKPIHRAIFEKGVRFVRNYATTEAILGSDWANFPIPVYNAIEHEVSRRLAAAKQWRMTNPEGTDLTGTSGGLLSWVMAGGGDTMNETKHREFPPGNHIPVDSIDAQGLIYTRSTYAWGARIWGLPLIFEDPVKLTVEHNRVLKVEGGKEADLYQRAMEFIAVKGNVGDEAYNVDSWHTGLHPKAQVPTAPHADPDLWWHPTHHHPDFMHFHIGGDPGRDYGTNYMTHLSALFFNTTLYLDGEKLIDNGRFTVFDDPEMRRVAAEYGDPNELFNQRPLWL